MADSETDSETETDSKTEAGSDSGADADADKEAPLPGAGTPEGESLAKALAAFERGDYVEVRQLTEKLVEAPDAEVAGFARDLLTRTQIDPVQVGVVLACLALFAYIVYTYVL